MNETLTASRPLKILHTCAQLGQRRAQSTQLLHIAAQATEQGHVSIVASSDAAKSEQTEALLRAGGLHITMPFEGAFTPLKSFFTAPMEGLKLAKHAKQNNVDIIHAHDIRTMGPALWAGKAAGIPVILHVSNAAATPARYMARADHITVSSAYTAKKIKPKSHVLPPCYDHTALKSKDDDAHAIEAFWAEWDVPAATPVLLITEPLVEGSGYRTFIEALGRIKKLHFKAILCANYSDQQPLFTDLWRRIDALKLGKEILFIERPSDADTLKNIIAASDVVAFTAPNPEADAQSVVETQALGRPVIVASPGNRADIVRSGETGWKVKLNNAETAAEKLSLALTDALTDMTRLQKMGTTATRHCKEHYTAQGVCTDLFDFYTQIRHANK